MMMEGGPPPPPGHPHPIEMGLPPPPPGSNGAPPPNGGPFPPISVLEEGAAMAPLEAHPPDSHFLLERRSPEVRQSVTRQRLMQIGWNLLIRVRSIDPTDDITGVNSLIFFHYRSWTDRIRISQPPGRSRRRT